ncbi:MAG: hypothetical protein IPM24_05150 [Bryobacterales bacterium]|nr:hypothetical protein [Bryobacterales bacterium]
MPFLDPPESTGTYGRMKAEPDRVWVACTAAALIAGGLLTALAMGWLPAPPPRQSRGLLLLVGLVFTFTGLMMVRQAVDAIRNRRRLTADGWLADYPWDPAGASDDTRRELRDAPWSLGLMGGFLAAITWGFATADMPASLSWLPFLFLAPFHGFLLYGVYRYATRLRQWSRVGLPRLRFVTPPPFAPGQTVDLRLEGSATLAGTLTAELRCVEETLVGSGTGRPRAQQHRVDAVFRESWPVLADSRGGATFRVTVPDEGASTQLRHDRYPPLRYWELGISGKGYSGVFLIPVYSRPHALNSK